MSNKQTKSAFERWRESRIEIFLNDFGELSRHQAANLTLGPPRADEKRVVFFGDSIVDAWDLDSSFPGKHYINRGISGQTTSQMLLRFRQDVIALKPSIVVVHAGTNDIAGNTGSMRLDQIEGNFVSMTELAAANGIAMIIASVLPVHDMTPETHEYFERRSPPAITDINRRLSAYCRRTGCIYLDYFNALVSESGLMKRTYSDDGLHPNRQGYTVMAPLAEAAIAHALH